MGLSKEERLAPSVKTLGYCQLWPEYYEMGLAFSTELLQVRVTTTRR